MADVVVGLPIEEVEVFAIVVQTVMLGGFEDERVELFVSGDLVMVVVASLTSAALMLKGWDHWNVSALAVSEILRPYLASLPSLESTSHRYLPLTLLIPAIEESI